MQFSITLIAFAASALATAIPQGVTAQIPAPDAPAAGCSLDSPNGFQITTVNATGQPGSRKQKRQDDDSQLILSIKGGVMTSQLGDTGYIADNFQFQFDNPPQTGAIYTSGFSYCAGQGHRPENTGSIAHGGSLIWYSCNSGGFNNIYDRNWAPQCSPIFVDVIGGTGSGSAGGSSGGASSSSDGQATATTAASGVASSPDGQPTATSGAPGVSSQMDGQPTAPAGAPAVSSQMDGQPTAPAGAPAVSSQMDGQPTAPAGAPAVSSQMDGQPTAPAGAPAVSSQADGQPTAPTGAPAITQISDNQPQAPTSASAAITQIGDNQPQAPTYAASPATPTPAQYTGAAAHNGFSGMAAAGVAVVGLALL